MLDSHAGVLKPNLVVNIKTEDESRLRIQSASFVSELDNSLIIAYGGDTLLLPAFETMVSLSGLIIVFKGQFLQVVCRF